MGDRVSNQMDVGEKAVGIVLGNVERRNPFRIGSKLGKPLLVSYVPARGIHNGNIMSMRGVQDPEDATQNSGGSKRGKVSWGR